MRCSTEIIVNRVITFAESKIDEDGGEIFCEENILEFEVTVADVFGV